MYFLFISVFFSNFDDVNVPIKLKTSCILALSVFTE